MQYFFFFKLFASLSELTRSLLQFSKNRYNEPVSELESQVLSNSFLSQVKSNSFLIWDQLAVYFLTTVEVFQDGFKE